MRRGIAMHTITGSGYWMWLAATTRGPFFGTFSIPRMVRPKRRRQSPIMKSRKRWYRRDILAGVLRPLKALNGPSRPAPQAVGEAQDPPDDFLEIEGGSVQHHGV